MVPFNPMEMMTKSAFAWFKIGLGAMAMGQHVAAQSAEVMTRGAADLWAPTAPTPRSWYRKPSTAETISPIAAWADAVRPRQTTLNPMMQATFGSWVAPSFGAAGPAVFWQPWLSLAPMMLAAWAWSPFVARQDGLETLSTLAKLPAAVVTDVAAVYRSAGGHAVAQIAFPAVVPFGAVDATNGNPWLDLGISQAFAPFTTPRIH
jgi:hypothetical protein